MYVLSPAVNSWVWRQQYARMHGEYVCTYTRLYHIGHFFLGVSKHHQCKLLVAPVDLAAWEKAEHTTQHGVHYQCATKYNWRGCTVQYTYVCISTYICTVLEIMVSIQTLSDHFGILSDPKKLGSDIWLSTTSCHFTHTQRWYQVICTENVYFCFHYLLMHIYCGTCVLLQKYVQANLKLSDPNNDAI